MTRERWTFAYCLACLLLADAAGAYAAEAGGRCARQRTMAIRSAGQSELLEEIVVTGSRAALPGFSASTPTTVVGSDAARARERAQYCADPE